MTPYSDAEMTSLAQGVAQSVAGHAGHRAGQPAVPGGARMLIRRRPRPPGSRDRGRDRLRRGAGRAARHRRLGVNSVRSDQQWVLDMMNVHAAWPLTQGSGVTVAVIDSGVYPGIGGLSGSVIDGPDLTGVGTGPSNPNWGVHGTWMASLIHGHGHGPGGG